MQLYLDEGHQEALFPSSRPAPARIPRMTKAPGVGRVDTEQLFAQLETVRRFQDDGDEKAAGKALWLMHPELYRLALIMCKSKLHAHRNDIDEIAMDMVLRIFKRILAGRKKDWRPKSWVTCLFHEFRFRVYNDAEQFYDDAIPLDTQRGGEA